MVVVVVVVVVATVVGFVVVVVVVVVVLEVVYGVVEVRAMASCSLIRRSSVFCCSRFHQGSVLDSGSGVVVGRGVVVVVVVVGVGLAHRFLYTACLHLQYSFITSLSLR